MHNADIPVTVIKTQKTLFRLNLRELWTYRDLLFLMVKRDIAVVYKQTVLGPLWFFLQPVLTTLMFTLIFGRIARIDTAGIPAPLFYLSALIGWNYFAACLNETSQIFRNNAHIFGKVYFPRLVAPVSTILSNLLKFLIQYALFIAVWIYYYVQQPFQVHWLWLLPGTLFIILVLGITGLGAGLFISSLTTKYRDLSFLVQFGVQLLMYATPVIYSVNNASFSEEFRLLLWLNPLTSLIEAFRFWYLGAGTFEPLWILYSLSAALLLLLGGILVFNYVERDFMDTV
ncbi:MAG: ABC transporter permease [Bacteroidia bacterium]|nr:ABC transporter permease [Bacteroidia bacterium]